MKTRISIIVFMLLISSVSCSGIFYDAPRPPCDQPIPDKRALQDAILSHPVIRLLDSQFKRSSFYMSECFVKGAVTPSMLYQLTPDLSPNGIVYNDIVTLSYDPKNIKFEVILPDASGRFDLEYEKVISNWKRRILAVEDSPNPRIREVFQKIKPTHGSLINGHLTRELSPGLWWIEYNFDLKRQRYEYSLPNGMEWVEFPEIKMAHGIVKENLAVINSTNCYIPQNGLWSTTGGKQWGPEDRSWFMNVPLTCPDSLKTASVRINPDGSFEALRIT